MKVYCPFHSSTYIYLRYLVVYDFLKAFVAAHWDTIQQVRERVRAANLSQEEMVGEDGSYEMLPDHEFRALIETWGDTTPVPDGTRPQEAHILTARGKQWLQKILALLTNGAEWPTPATMVALTPILKEKGLEGHPMSYRLIHGLSWLYRVWAKVSRRAVSKWVRVWAPAKYY